MRRTLDLLLAASRLLLGVLFMWAAATKVTDLAGFAEEVADYRLLPPVVVPWIAVVVPGIEVAAGLALLAGVWTRAGALLVSGMLVVFIAGLSQSLLRGIDLRCGCFGGTDVATWTTVVRDVLLLAPSLLVLRFGPGPLRLPLGVEDGGAAARRGP